MDLRDEITYPTSDPEAAFALVVDPDFRAEVCEASHALDYDVSVDSHQDGSADVTVNRVMPADLPDAMKKMVGETVTIVQTEAWGAPGSDGARVADLLISIKGQPATMKGTIEMAPTGGQVVSTIAGDVKVAVPFFGKKIEPEIAKAIIAAIRVEQKTVRARLGG